MARSRYFQKRVTVFMFLFCSLLLSEILACSSQRFNKQDRFFRRHNHRRYYGKRSTNNYEQEQAARSAKHEKYEFVLNTTCDDVLCDSVPNYPQEAIMNAVKELQQIYQSEKVSFSEEIDSQVINFLSEYIKSHESSIDHPEIVYEESKGCKASGNVSFPQEGYSNEDGQIYYVVNVPNLQQKANHLTCKRTKTECGDNSIQLPSTYFRTCQQVHREEEFLVLPTNRSQYGVDDFRVRAFLVPNGCKCILLHTGDYEFLKSKIKD